LADSSAGIEADPEISVVEKIRQLDMKCRDFRLEGNDMSFCDEEILEEYSNLPMDTVPLQSLNFGSKSELVVVFGGETHGLSDQAKKLAHSQQGCKFFVPLRNNVDSLNVASAASVVLFHLQAQLV
jgi:tRNA G18 (ribose-2'-O)-methylase SpoU